MSTRTDSHTISVAENLFQGDAYHAGAEGGGRGLPVFGVVRADLGAPIIGDVDGIITAAGSGNNAAAGDVPIDGTFLSDGVAVLDVARTLVVDSTSASDTSQDITITGTDMYGAPMVETINLNGTTAVVGLKAFKTITAVNNDTAIFVGDLTVGTTDALGLPFALDSIGDLFLANEAGIVATIGTVVAAVTTNPATAVTGDVRGTYDPTDTLDGSATIVLYYFPKGRKTITGYGLPQYSG